MEGVWVMDGLDWLRLLQLRKATPGSYDNQKMRTHASAGYHCCWWWRQREIGLATMVAR